MADIDLGLVVGSTGPAATVSVDSDATERLEPDKDGNPVDPYVIDEDAGNPYNATLAFGIPVGEKGDTATIEVGKTTTGQPGSDAEVVNSGDKHAAVLDFTVPQGPVGQTGPAPYMAVEASAETLNTGAAASVTVTQTGGSGIESDPYGLDFEFGLPRGEQGSAGSIEVEADDPLSSAFETRNNADGTTSEVYTVTHDTSGVSEGTSGATSAQKPDFGDTAAVPYITTDTYGHVTARGTSNLTIPSTEATTSSAGLMSAENKAMLDALSALIDANASGSFAMPGTQVIGIIDSTEIEVTIYYQDGTQLGTSTTSISSLSTSEKVICESDDASYTLNVYASLSSTNDVIKSLTLRGVTDEAGTCSWHLRGGGL